MRFLYRAAVVAGYCDNNGDSALARHPSQHHGHQEYDHHEQQSGEWRRK